MLDKHYQPEAVETERYREWQEAGAFAANSDSNARPYTIMMPPPNVTGSLHIGHALTFTLQDILIRYARARGRDALWQPGTDHAGIATQLVVERQLKEQGKTKHDLGRDGFIETVWRWKEQSGGTIMRQLERLGASADWRRERFTMDEGLSAAVRKVFVDLYGQGLIYKDKRLVNWDPVLRSAVSDLEVDQREVKGSLWYLAYPIEGSDETITVATTRPETMLGDSGVAVHPDDPRYQHLIGRFAIVPLVGRRIPIVADEYSDPEKGSGAVKITPAHDFNDFEVGRRHGLELINIFDQDAKLNDAVPEPYRGLDRFKARDRIVADLEAAGVLVKREPHTHMVPHCERSDAIVEPFLTDQWYCDAKTLAQPAIKAVEDGSTSFVPKQWEATYFEWMRNIQPWCISRQLWWGHQIPAWYGPDNKVFVALDEAAAAVQARAHYGKDVTLSRDPDVLDTWFSSALWPFSTLGWPERTKELARYYPTDVLVTGFDIIFFWVARMMMMGLHFMGDVPFRTVYIHALVRDAKGQKMSKSKGNVIDPLALIDRFGADSVRFTLAALAAPGRDVKLAEPRVEGYRNFVTKLWNASRYAEMNNCRYEPGFDPAGVAATVNRWIVGATNELAGRMIAALGAYRFNDAANLLYQFVWGSFCDWYLEFTKPILTGEPSAVAAETRATTGWVLREIVLMLHPIAPFVTEELWHQLGLGSGLLMQQVWAAERPAVDDREAKAEMEWVIDAISQIRALRSEMNVPPVTEIPVTADVGAENRHPVWIATHRDAIERLARVTLDSNSERGVASKDAVPIFVGPVTLLLNLAGLVDFAKERTRLQKDIGRVAGELAKIDAKLSKPDFLAKADPAVIEENRERRQAFMDEQGRLQAALDRLAGL
jgi:valyl-tRNA synthetase